MRSIHVDVCNTCTTLAIEFASTTQFNRKKEGKCCKKWRLQQFFRLKSLRVRFAILLCLFDDWEMILSEWVFSYLLFFMHLISVSFCWRRFDYLECKKRFKGLRLSCSIGALILINFSPFISIHYSVFQTFYQLFQFIIHHAMKRKRDKMEWW